MARGAQAGLLRKIKMLPHIYTICGTAFIISQVSTNTCIRRCVKDDILIPKKEFFTTGFNTAAYPATSLSMSSLSPVSRL